jgi:GNAT superfamily N-acetyltransferase
MTDSEDAMLLWSEGWSNAIGNTDAQVVPVPLAAAEAWVAYLDGVAIGLQAAIPFPQSPRVNHLLSWVSPDYRGMGVWTTIAERMDADLAQRGYQFYISWVVASEQEMLAAVQSRGGVIQQYRTRRPVIGAQ